MMEYLINNNEEKKEILNTDFLTNTNVSYVILINHNKCIYAMTGGYGSNDGEYLSINWCYIAKEWEYDREMERLLKDNFPFRAVKEKYITRYSFDK
jgi:hypothetical protein